MLNSKSLEYFIQGSDQLFSLSKFNFSTVNKELKHMKTQPAETPPNLYWCILAIKNIQNASQTA